MQQLVDVPTHKNGNILDVIMMEEMSSAKIVNTAVGDFLSDHKFVSTSVEFIKKGSELKKVKARDLKKIDVNLLNSQLKLISLDNNLDTNEMANQLEDQLCRVLDDIAPEKEKLRFDTNPKPWFDDNVSLARSHYKKCQKSWSKTKCEVDWQAVRLSRNQYTRALQTAKRIFYSEKVIESKGNTKGLYTTINGLIDRQKTNPMPEDLSSKELADHFSDYFHNKIMKIRSKLEIIPDYEPTVRNVPKMENFELLTVEHVIKIITKLYMKQCELDKFPTKL